ncbi:hypothetical protein LC085_14820 [Bacillus tianshenii]|uniref:hypothetical protein n=1 Tax=Sutcliffiella tianshenii TaxID=1463404 RepID=UPI001CD64323|nr:hypothetical protein [Bacillus tianshenii]MCA1321192.1 hypothetical protein [Bacillus tianshenii]
MKVPLLTGMVLFFGLLFFHFSETGQEMIPSVSDEVLVPFEDAAEIFIFKSQKKDVYSNCVSLLLGQYWNCSDHVKSYLDSYIPKVKLKERLSHIHHKVLVFSPNLLLFKLVQN